MKQNQKGFIQAPAFRKKSGAGFTLIELLVVISVIGLLASVVLVALNSARIKARDARRISDFKQIQTAIEMYYNNNSYYPNAGGTSSTYCINGAGWTDLKTALTSAGLVSSLPSDPGSNSYLYCSDRTSNSQEYLLSAQMETNPAVSFQGVFFTAWGGDDLSCAGKYCLVVCRNVVDAEGPKVPPTYPDGYSWSPPNCGSYQ